ncbi:MAG: type III secretion protein [Succinivibrio sp.]|nr:type III secretion protein [Succinivibrio sp.]
MAGYPLARLVTLRQHRFDEAQRNCATAEQKVQQGQTAIVNKKKEIDEYIIWREAEINRRYDAIMNKELTSEGFEKFKKGLADLQMQEVKLNEQLYELKEQLKQLEEALVQAKEELKQAGAALNKLEEHRKIWTAQARIEAERKEEKELEDFKSRKLY